MDNAHHKILSRMVTIRYIGVTIGLIFFVFMPQSCIQHTEQELTSNVSDEVDIPEIRHAKGFDFVQTDSTILLRVFYPSTGEAADSIVISHTTQGVKRFERTAIQSTTHFAFFDRLNNVNQLIGLCGKRYLSAKQAKSAEHLIDICSETGFNLEKIAELHPDFLLVYPFEQKDLARFYRLGIQTLLITEYLEQTPLARAEWLKFFGVMTGNKAAAAVFDEIETSYLKQVQKQSIGSVALNLPFGDQWNMPSGKSITAQLLKDAGLDYLFSNKQLDGNVVLSMEEGYDALSKADYWVIITERPQGFSLKDLLVENKIYATFPSVQNGKVILCNTTENDYFSKGVIEPHLLLQDLLTCIGLSEVETSGYFRELK